MTASIPGIEASRQASIEASRRQASRPAGKQASRPAGGRHRSALDKKRKQKETEKVGPRPDTASAAKLAEPSPKFLGTRKKESKRETLPPNGGRSNQRARVRTRREKTIVKYIYVS